MVNACGPHNQTGLSDDRNLCMARGDPEGLYLVWPGKAASGGSTWLVEPKFFEFESAFLFMNPDVSASISGHILLATAGNPAYLGAATQGGRRNRLRPGTSFLRSPASKHDYLPLPTYWLSMVRELFAAGVQAAALWPSRSRTVRHALTAMRGCRRRRHPHR